MRRLLPAICCWLLTLALADAQDMRVYTLTFDCTDVGPQDAAKAPVVARSLTIFHAGKVYDYIDSLREVTIFEPVHHRFTVLHDVSCVTAEVTQDEVRRYLALFEKQARERSTELARRTNAAEAASLDSLQFQLRPEFQAKFDATHRRLILDSPTFRYDVECVTAPAPELQQIYLKYADAISELNAVLHPHSMLPGPRMQLNRELRERAMLPHKVSRTTNFGREVVLRAEHHWSWTLLEHDRQMIAHWEGQLKRKELRQVSFEQLQKEVLSGHVTQR